LISKKDCRRPGRRFIVRGIDRDGNVVNHVSTEHVFTLYGQGQALTVASYIQTRGSVPLYWSQKPTLKYNPTVKVNPNQDETMIAARKHLDEASE
jgi:phosphatidylinositol 4-phosphatase